MKGWICPKCNTALAPWVDRCNCSEEDTTVSDRTTVWEPPTVLEEPTCPFCKHTGICTCTLYNTPFSWDNDGT